MIEYVPANPFKDFFNIYKLHQNFGYTYNKLKNNSKGYYI